MASGPGAKSIDKCLSLNQVKLRRFDKDILIEGYPVYK